MIEGSVSIELSRPLDISGAKVSVLQMREPTVEDQLVADKMGGDNRQTEIVLFANLCGVTPDDIKHMSLRDYRKVQQAFMGFIN
ncbi:phage tail assembly protein (plasmid) [Roseomonas marmotae]|uniref:phage tail assembly protein n=1 Tax=Roseomonas marmotae TaxID=2768161 RepID=UPI001AD6E7A3|nr:phage tail assembly protein [Roseomonas marmotae]QTI81503.1 phage tail assembly protein [Roseomonas marmotae]